MERPEEIYVHLPGGTVPVVIQPEMTEPVDPEASWEGIPLALWCRQDGQED